MKNICILLTGCVNPNGMTFTKLQDSSIRKSQYIDALKFYTSIFKNVKLVFVENTNCTYFKDLFKDDIQSGKLEFLCFDGNHYDRKFGKGYGEFEIIDYAMNNSKFIKESDFIIKITGRIKVTNILDICKNLSNINENELMYSGNFRMLKKMALWTHIFITNYKTMIKFLKYKKDVNDSISNSFEDLILKSLKEENIHIYSLNPIPKIDGVSGTNNKQYSIMCSNISIDNDYKMINEIRNCKQ